VPAPRGDGAGRGFDFRERRCSLFDKIGHDGGGWAGKPRSANRVRGIIAEMGAKYGRAAYSLRISDRSNRDWRAGSGATRRMTRALLSQLHRVGRVEPAPEFAPTDAETQITGLPWYAAGRHATIADYASLPKPQLAVGAGQPARRGR
jgi:hypothetical protein